jgi:hypothetical protein
MRLRNSHAGHQENEEVAPLFTGNFPGVCPLETVPALSPLKKGAHGRVAAVAGADVLLDGRFGSVAPCPQAKSDRLPANAPLCRVP